jgi:hypothetical protein
MGGTSMLSKLAELRLKTDRELAAIIDAELQLGFDFLRQMRSASLDSVETPRVGAEKAHAEAVKLMPLLDDSEERQRLERKVRQLREGLDRLAASRKSRIHPACSLA